ncbi:hypothetical protein [Robiginitalea marina]|uniref:Lipoprotein n=1 Tax=Robiginitalea marina TaxID=2954105 RepID=A0ABT1AZC7_9FLAO|nr:hypothetical protein [Robiginitalea marina]MCO5725291.1 hypothetical protein [Robiginitalea marina]
MKQKLLLLIAATLLLQCSGEKEEHFLVGPERVGKLMRTHRLSQLDSIYRSDSLVRDTTRLNLGINGKIEVFEKGGRHLLTLSPGADTLKGVENIRIRDPRFKTPEGVGLQSTFGDITKAYEIRKVVSSPSNVLILLKNSPVYFTISREELPGAIRYSNQPIEAIQIPGEARIKYMMVAWE